MNFKFIVSCILLLSCVSCDFNADPVDLGSTSTSIANSDNRSDATSGIGSGDQSDSGSGAASSSSARASYAGELMEDYYGEYSEMYPDDNDKSIMGYYYLNGYTPDSNVYYGGISSYRMVFSVQDDIVIEWSMSPQD